MKEPGLDNRHSDERGEIRRKRDDTLVGTLRKTYGPEFRNDATLGTVLERTRCRSLAELLKEQGR